MPARTIGTLDRNSMRISGYFLEFEADLGAQRRGKKWPTYKRHTIRIPIWTLRFLIRDARKAFNRKANAMIDQSLSILRAAEVNE